MVAWWRWARGEFARAKQQQQQQQPDDTRARRDAMLPPPGSSASLLQRRNRCCSKGASHVHNSPPRLPPAPPHPAGTNGHHADWAQQQQHHHQHYGDAGNGDEGQQEEEEDEEAAARARLEADAEDEQLRQLREMFPDEFRQQMELEKQEDGWETIAPASGRRRGTSAPQYAWQTQTLQPPPPEKAAAPAYPAGGAMAAAAAVLARPLIGGSGGGGSGGGSGGGASAGGSAGAGAPLRPTDEQLQEVQQRFAGLGGEARKLLQVRGWIGFSPVWTRPRGRSPATEHASRGGVWHTGTHAQTLPNRSTSSLPMVELHPWQAAPHDSKGALSVRKRNAQVLRVRRAAAEKEAVSGRPVDGVPALPPGAMKVRACCARAESHADLARCWHCTAHPSKLRRCG